MTDAVKFVTDAVRHAHAYFANDLPATAERSLRTSLAVREDTSLLLGTEDVFSSLLEIARRSQQANPYVIDALLRADERGFALIA